MSINGTFSIESPTAVSTDELKYTTKEDREN